jgi:hypothetical protein
MTRYVDLKKLVSKNKKKTIAPEDPFTFKEVKREKSQKHYRNYDNALRSRNIDRLLSYDD